MSVILKDLNDYIAPSQACIKPVEVNKTSSDNKNVILMIYNNDCFNLKLHANLSQFLIEYD